MRRDSIDRRRFLALLGTGLVATRTSARALAADKKPELTWHDVAEWGVEGKGWKDTVRFYDRLPAMAERVVRPPVWSLSRHSAGMAARFETDSKLIWTRYTLSSKRLAMPHMPATGVSGVDLYARDEQRRWRWVSITRPSAQKVETRLISGLRDGRREYMLYLPLYNGVESLEIGVDPKAAFKPLAPRAAKPLLFYGTSITHGACASRPGMCHPAILGRRLDCPVINLGFSGNGIMEPEVGALLAELDPCVYVIDCLPNMKADLVAKRAEPLVRQLRKARPTTPIVLVEDRTYANAPFLPASQKRHRTSRAALRKAYETLTAAGVKGLHYVKGEGQLGDDSEGTTDSSHPNDLGFMRMADALEPTLRPLVRGT